MTFTLERTLTELRRQRLMLVQPGEVFPGSRMTPRMQQSLQRHRKDLAQLMRDGDITLCINPDLHRRSWFYRDKRYYCALCKHFVEVGIC